MGPRVRKVDNDPVGEWQFWRVRIPNYDPKKNVEQKAKLLYVGCGPLPVTVVNEGL